MCINHFYRYISFIFFILFIPLSHSQTSKIDSLNIELLNAQSITDSVNAINQIAIYYKRKDKNKFIEYVQLLDSLAQRTSDTYINGINHKLKAISANNAKEYNKSAIEAENALQKFIKIKDTTNINKSLYSLFRAYRNLKSPEQVKETYQKYQHHLTPKWVFEYHYQLARYYLEVTETDKSITSLKKALAIGEALQDNQLLGKGYYKLGQIYRGLKNYDDAILNLNLALNTLDPKKNSTIYGATYSIIGEVYKHKKEHRLAISYFDSAISYQKIEKLPKSVSKTLSSKAISYLHLREFDSAKSSVKKAIKMHKEEGDELALAYAYSRLGNICFYADKKSDSAIYYMEQSIEIGKKYNQKRAIKASYYNLNNFLYDQGNYKEARNSLKQAYKYADTLYDEKLNSRLKDVEFELKRAEDKNTILQQEKEIKSKELLLAIKQRNLLVSISIGCLALLLGGLMYFQKRKKESQLQNTIEHVKNLTNKVLSHEEEIVQRKNNLNSTSFGNYLIKEYNLTKATFEYWDRQAFGVTEKEMETLFKISKSSVQSRRKELYKRLSTKTSIEEYDRHSSVSLYLEEIVDFMNTKIQNLQSDSEE